MKIICIVSCAGLPKNIPLLRRCLRSIHKAQYPFLHIYTVVTTNHNKRYIQQLDNLIDQIIVSPESAGFVEINNEAVEKTKTIQSDFHLFINDDAWINPNFFSEVRNIYESTQKSDILVPLVYQQNSTGIDSFGVEYFLSGYAKNSSSLYTKTTLATMSCLCIKSVFLKKMIQTYGFFLHPMLHWYFDDIEFSIRALAIGGHFYKAPHLVAHHIGTFTWIKKSSFVIYQNYRNLLWTIILTWPKKYVYRYGCSIICIQTMLFWYSLLKYGPGIYWQIGKETIKNWEQLQLFRKRVIKKYPQSFVFETIFSPHRLRTKYGTF